MMKFDVLNIKELTKEDFENAFADMSKERQDRCLRYKFLDDRRRMAFGEMLLKKLISEEYKCERESICLKNLPSGKPVAYLDGKEIFVSITHSGNFVACAFADTPVGIDLEAKREIKPDFLNRALNAEELEFVKESGEDAVAFLKIWTAKEAYLKLTGEGLAGLKNARVMALIKNGEKDGLKLNSFVKDEYVLTIIY